MKNNCCPYCRSKCDYLPVVNGLKKLKIDINSIYKELKNQLEFNPEKAKYIIRLNNALQFHQGVYIFTLFYNFINNYLGRIIWINIMSYMGFIGI